MTSGEDVELVLVEGVWRAREGIFIGCIVVAGEPSTLFKG